MKISVTIRPNSKQREEVTKRSDGSLVIITKFLATEGMANKAAIVLLAKYYDIPKSRI